LYNFNQPYYENPNPYRTIGSAVYPMILVFKDNQ